MYSVVNVIKLPEIYDFSSMSNVDKYFCMSDTHNFHPDADAQISIYVARGTYTVQ